MADRAKELAERLENLKKLKAEELKLKKKGSPKYILDLNFSIEGCERELAFLNKNPNGVGMVNGV